MKNIRSIKIHYLISRNYIFEIIVLEFLFQINFAQISDKVIFVQHTHGNNYKITFLSCITFEAIMQHVKIYKISKVQL